MYCTLYMYKNLTLHSPHTPSPTQAHTHKTLITHNTFNPCHGRLPILKYINIYPSDSKSSLLLCSVINNENYNIIIIVHVYTLYIHVLYMYMYSVLNTCIIKDNNWQKKPSYCTCTCTCTYVYMYIQITELPNDTIC